PSRMLQCIKNEPGITWIRLKTTLKDKYGYSETGGGISASLRVLLIDGYISIEGTGDNKRIFPSPSLIEKHKNKPINKNSIHTNDTELNNIEYINPVVAKLFSIQERQQAFEEIISWQKYKGEKNYEETIGKVGHVVICPQIEGIVNQRAIMTPL
ncbi:hypothetical protein HQ531_10545, partial [bacterium]|nr:hypothetical protein [bacterium]